MLIREENLKEMDRIEEIRYGDYIAKINLSRGANCVSLRNGSMKLLREPDYTKELDNPYLYGMPILFPVNRISGGCFEFEGRKYQFPINEPETNCHLHGVIHNSAFELLNKEDGKINCVFRPNNDDAYVKVGHDYIIEIEYTLNKDGFKQCVSVENLSDINMPVMIGFHTTFNTLFACGKAEDTFVYAQISEEYERNMKNYLPTGKILVFDDVSDSLSNGVFKPFQTPISRHYRAYSEGEMIIYDRYNNLSLVYENDKKYQFRLIFNRGEFICLEPQNCMANCQNSPFERKNAGFDFLKPKEIKKYYSQISVCKGDRRTQYCTNLK